MQHYINENADKLTSCLDERFMYEELKNAIKKLKNNKATSFDKTCNEMIKSAFPVISESVLLLFNTILSSSLYPSAWKQDILGPLHKAGSKDDPGNFRGISLSSCLGKVFNSLLRNRLESKCNKEKIISNFQISGEKGARTSDHLLVFRHIINKYVKIGKQLLFVCYFDLKKAFDTVNRVKMFYNFITVLQTVQNAKLSSLYKIQAGKRKADVHPMIQVVGFRVLNSLSPSVVNRREYWVNVSQCTVYHLRCTLFCGMS